MTRTVRPASSQRRRETSRRGREAPPRRDLGRLLAVGGLLLVALVAAGFGLAWYQWFRPIEGVVTFSNLSQDHVEEPQTYPQTPPVGGPHSGTWLNCGIYDSPVPNENAVHSLEHGTVWITYRPDLAAEDVERLRAVARGRSHAIVSPYPDLPSPVVVSAWGLQLQVESASDPRIERFMDRYEQGPQTPEPGASCRGNVGAPIER